MQGRRIRICSESSTVCIYFLQVVSPAMNQAGQFFMLLFKNHIRSLSFWAKYDCQVLPRKKHRKLAFFQKSRKLHIAKGGA